MTLPSYFPRMVEAAVEMGRRSPCAKSKRGVVAWDPFTKQIVGRGFNAPPFDYRCAGDDACRAACGKICVHAEMNALFNAGRNIAKSDLLHIKVVDGVGVPSGPPSCWQCSRNLLGAGVSYVWLLHEDGWKRYHASEFHRETLLHCELPTFPFRPANAGE